MIELKPAASGGYRAYSGKFCIGDVVTGKMNRYAWWPTEGGHWSEDTLREVADCLQQLNSQAVRASAGESTGPITGRNYKPSKDSSVPFDT